MNTAMQQAETPDVSTDTSSSDGRIDLPGERLLQRLNQALAHEERPIIVVRAALDALVSELGAKSAAVFFSDFEAGVSRLVYSVNYPDDVVEQLREVGLDRPAIANLALRSGEVQVISSRDAAPSQVELTKVLGERMGIRAAAAIPLMVGGRRLGVLVYGLGDEHTFSDAEVSLLTGIGTRIAVTLERARLEDELARRAEEAELLHSIAAAAAGEDRLDLILKSTLDRLSSFISFTGGSIALVEGDDLIVAAAVGPFTESALGQRLPRGRGRSWQIISTREPFLSNDLAASGVRALSGDAEQPICSYLAVPLIWRGQAFGLLEVDSTQPNAFRQSAAVLMQRVATLLSGPIELARRYAEEVALRRDLDQAKGRLEAILHHAPMAVFFFDAKNRLIYANRASYDTVQLLSEDVLMTGRSWQELAERLIERRWGGTPDQLREMIDQTRELREGILVHDFPLRDPDQTLLRIAAPVFESHEFSGHVVILIDVTAEREARAAAEQALAMRDRFISIASHELRTPLTSIKGVAQLMQRMFDTDRTDPVRLGRHVDTIVTQAGRLQGLIDDLLDISRIQSGRLELRLEPVDLARIVRELIEDLPDDRRRRMSLVTPESVVGRWDALRLEQVTMNLIDNALKYSPLDTMVNVTIEGDGDAAVLTVADRGIGIPASDLEGLFEPFARATNAAVRDESGLGLGLYITRQIVERHGGTISVTSTEGQGSTFTVRLPTGGER